MIKQKGYRWQSMSWGQAMKCEVREIFIAITLQGEVPVEPGQVLSVSNEKLLLELINDGRVTPLKNASWLIYSDILQDLLWTVPDEEARGRLLAKGVKEAVYTEAEIDLLQGPAKRP